MKHVLKISVLLICAITLFAGCYQSPSELITPSANPSATLKPGTTVSAQSGGEITIPMPQEPYTTHPLFIKEIEMSDIYSMVFEPLIALDESRMPTVSIATGWERTEDGNITVHLRSGVRFHDNTELTSADVAFTFNKILQSPDSIYFSLVDQYVESVTVLDRHSLSFTPKISGYAFFYALNVPIIPEAIYSETDDKTDIIPIGTGSFSVTYIDVGPTSEMELVRNVYWWKKQPYIERIHAVGYSDNKDAIDAFIRGELDCVPTSIYTTDIYDSYDGVSCYSYMSNYYDFLAPNFKNKTLDTTVRRAISYAIDRKNIISNIYINHGISMEYPFVSDIAINNTDIIRYDYSLQEANRLLDGDGWVLNQDGVRQKDNKKLSFELITVRNDDNPVRRDTAQTIRRQLALVGIEITVTVLDKDKLATAIAGGDFDLLLTGYYLSDCPDVSFAFRSGGSGNVMNYSSSECNRLLDEMDKALTRDEYAAAYSNIQQFISTELPQIGLISFSQTLLHKDSLVPSGIYRDLCVYENIDKWFVIR